MSNLYILGNGGFAHEVREQIKEQYTDLGFGGYIYKEGDAIMVESPFNTIKEFTFPKFSSFLLGTGNKFWRAYFIDLIDEYYGVSKEIFPNIIADNCYLSCYAKIGIGNLLCTNSIVLGNAILGDFNLLNVQTLVSHDCVIGDHNLLNPKVSVLGTCKIGSNNYLATNVTIIPKITIGNNNTISVSENIVRDINNSIFFKDNKESSKYAYSIQKL